MSIEFKRILNNIGLKKLIKSNDLEVENIENSFGTRVNAKIDLTNIGNEDITKLKTLLMDKGMLVIPSHRILNEEEQIKITNFFGRANKNVSYISPHTIINEQVVTNNNTYLSSALWHCDHPNLKNPPHISVFQILDDVNSNWETAFISLHEVCSNISEEQKKDWLGINVMYSGEDIVHPLLRVHPFTGKQSLYFDFRFVKEVFNICEATGEIMLKNSNEIVFKLNELFSKHISVYNHKWCSGDIVIIDNYTISRREVSTPDTTKTSLARRSTTEGIYF
ncbi:TauD/TfdA dioxygenase family protein [Hyunsoonleella ulvae]|uniref:TauD/TfdA dioxygenase family protein n=1 Tax=Hyunsoonleella ulvae TaxID=2799948 RepID=UPI001939DFD0|nr:TauD/TfdA family dioxygenase [Hyunsoonleella ulvae]